MKINMAVHRRLSIDPNAYNGATADVFDVNGKACKVFRVYGVTGSLEQVKTCSNQSVSLTTVLPPMRGLGTTSQRFMAAAFLRLSSTARETASGTSMRSVAPTASNCWSEAKGNCMQTAFFRRLPTYKKPGGDFWRRVSTCEIPLCFTTRTQSDLS